MRFLRKPNFKYLTNYSSIDEAKDKYKKLAISLHPDKGGDLREMQQLNLEWDYIKKTNYIPVVNKSYENKCNFNSTPKREKLDYEMAKYVIDSIFDGAIKSGKKVGITWFKFVEFLENNNYMTERKHLEYLAVKLKYSSGWAYYKSEELKQKGLI
jgi:curved DNA-binding protein CbpA